METKKEDKPEECLQIYDKGYPYIQMNDIINMPRKIKRSKKVVFDISDLRYEMIKNVAEVILQWQCCNDEPLEKEDWFIVWIEGYVYEDDVKLMLPFQKINHFPCSYLLCKKNYLSANLTKMAKLFPNDYDFSPRTWLIPQQFEEYKKHAEQSKYRNTYYICKPESACQGRGIFLTRRTEGISSTMHLIQHFLHIINPFLIDGLKFDFRVYVLVKSMQPLKIFMYPEGLARFATQQYQPPNKKNSDNLFMHLTNYAVNKKNPNFQYNESENLDNIGHKRSMTSVFKILHKQGHDVGKIQMEMRQLIVKTIISAQAQIANIMRQCQPKEKLTEFCFEIFGFDILLDEKLKPWIIEINHSPSFTSDTPLDLQIKRHLMIDSLNILNVSTKDKKKYIEMKFRGGTIPPILKVPQYYLPGMKNIDEDAEDILKEIHEYEESHKGAYMKILSNFLIFPAEDDPPQNYLKFLKSVKKQSSQEQQKTTPLRKEKEKFANFVENEKNLNIRNKSNDIRNQRSKTNQIYNFQPQNIQKYVRFVINLNAYIF